MNIFQNKFQNNLRLNIVVIRSNYKSQISILLLKYIGKNLILIQG